MHGEITDDTQMTLFTVEGLIRAGVRTDRGIGFTVGVVHHAYDRWLDTQLYSEPTGKRDGWLQGERWLYSRRAPGSTCLAALSTARQGGDAIPQFGSQVDNSSKGCGAVMRSAPFGLIPRKYGRKDLAAFGLAVEAAGFTHGHPTGKFAAGALSSMIDAIVDGADFDLALDTALAELTHRNGHEETSRALLAARHAAANDPARAETVERLEKAG